MLLRPLSHFRVYEDGQVRGDSSEGLLAFAPQGGLQITKQDGSAFTLEGWRFISSAKQDDIFVFCASNQLSAELADRFGSPFCVEVSDPDRLISRLKSRAHPTSHLDYEHLVGGKVDYRDLDQEPKIDWALPERLAFIKPKSFAWQDEFRIAVGKRGAFNVENVALKLETGAAAAPPVPSQAELFLRVGSLASLARLHLL